MDRITIVGCAYRLWALKIFDFIRTELNVNMVIFRDKSEVVLENIVSKNPALLLFYGWSWRVPDEIVNKYLCLCLHPSPLPKYRGGTPIQNQIMNGEVEGAVSIFRMNGEIDAGDLCGQESISLEGDLYGILTRITTVGGFMSAKIVRDFQRGDLQFLPQEGEPTVFARRSPEESEITRDELNLAPARYLYNKIRGLQDPYPNAFIVCPDGGKLYIKEAVCEDEIPTP